MLISLVNRMTGLSRSNSDNISMFDVTYLQKPYSICFMQIFLLGLSIKAYVCHIPRGQHPKNWPLVAALARSKKAFDLKLNFHELGFECIVLLYFKLLFFLVASIANAKDSFDFH